MCYLIKNTIATVLLCFSPNLEYTTNSFGYAWQLPLDQREYNALTISRDKKHHIVLLRQDSIGIGTIAHEVAHILSYNEELEGEDKAIFVGAMVDSIISICMREEKALYYLTPMTGKRIYIHD